MVKYGKANREEKFYEETNENQETFNPCRNHSVFAGIIPNQRECRRKNQAEHHKENNQCRGFLHREAAEQ